jgi:hypothetical protein
MTVRPAPSPRVVVMHVNVCQDGTVINAYEAPSAPPRVLPQRACLTPYRLDPSGVRTFRPECLPGVRGPWGSHCDVPYVVGATGIRTFKAECL